MPSSKLLDDYDDLCATARNSKAAIQAASIRPILANTTYAVEPTTCPCGNGKPLYSDTGVCVTCDESRFDARNRALPAAEQRD